MAIVFDEVTADVSAPAPRAAEAAPAPAAGGATEPVAEQLRHALELQRERALRVRAD